MMISYIWGRGALSLGGVQMEAGRREEDYLCEGREAAWFAQRCTLKGLVKVQERVKFLIQNASLFSYCYAFFLEGFRVNVVK